MDQSGIKMAWPLVVTPGIEAPKAAVCAVQKERVQSAHVICRSPANEWTVDACWRLQEELHRAGVEIAACSLETESGVSLNSSDRLIRRKAYESIISGLELASRLNSHILIPFDGLMERMAATKPPNLDDAYHWIMESILALRFEAEQRAVILAYTVGQERFIASPREARTFFDRVNSPWVKACVETTPVEPCEQLADWIAVLRHRIGAVRIDASIAEDSSASLQVKSDLRNSRCECILVVSVQNK